jgi:hypothetical protein
MSPLLIFLIPIAIANKAVSRHNPTQGLPAGSLLSIILLGVYALAVPSDNAAHGMQEGYKKFVDPSGRYALEYPATMSPDSVNVDEFKFIHPEASLRITIIVQPRTQKGIIDEQALLDSLKQNLAENSQDASIVEEGRLPGLPGKQGYFVCSFKDKRGVKVMQLVQYYVSNDKMLQLIISDRPQGFINVEKVIRRIHRSLKVLKPDLK